MDRFNELEKAWERRQKKQRIFGSIILVVGVAVFAFNYWYTGEESTKVTLSEKKSDTPVKLAQTPPAPVVKEPIPLPPEKKPKPVVKSLPLVLTLDRSFESSIAEQISSARREEASKPVAKEEAVKTEISTEAVEPSEKGALLIEKYHLDESYENALRVARFFYDMAMPKEAREWALTANKLDSADDESWILFAEASIALNEKEQAKNALATYLQKRDSLRVRQLYNQLKEEE